MPRGIPWDDLPNHYAGNQAEQRKKEEEANKLKQKQEKERKEVNLKQDALDIGRRVAFGALVSSLLSVLKFVSELLLFNFITLIDRRYSGSSFWFR
ncbi:MAG: hypothetical protein K2X53_05635 [Alphaproteobacteria bacterium]|nr:hypothetical protein [Alphaproteobacteria bacterium]